MITPEQSSSLLTYGIVIGCSFFVLLLGFLITLLSEKKEKTAYIDDGKAPDNLGIGNGIGFRMLGSYSRDFKNAVKRGEKKEEFSSPTNKQVSPKITEEEISLAISETIGVKIEAYKKRLQEDSSFADRQRRYHEWLKAEEIKKKTHTDFSSYMEGGITAKSKRVGYLFFCVVIPLIPIGCYAYSEISHAARSTTYRFYGSQRWDFFEVLSLYLIGCSSVAIVGSIIAIIWAFIF